MYVRFFIIDKWGNNVYCWNKRLIFCCCGDKLIFFLVLNKIWLFKIIWFLFVVLIFVIYFNNIFLL